MCTGSAASGVSSTATGPRLPKCSRRDHGRVMSPNKPWDARVRAIADEQQGFISHAQLRELEVTRSERVAQIEAQRWLPVHRRGVVVLHSESCHRGSPWLSLARVGPQARLGGVSALACDGLKGYEEPMTHIWVAKSLQKSRPAGVILHETRRWAASHAVTAGLPRSRPEVAIVQGALWARSARQAALVMTMSLQQRLATPAQVSAQLERVRRHPYRRALEGLLRDIAGGVESLNELDFATMCRERGFPEPTRQAIRRHANGRYVLDVHWDEFRAVVEIQGAGHLVLDKVLTDEVRLLDLAVDGDTMIPVSSATLRTHPEPFFAALARFLRSRGWAGTYHPAA